MTAIYDALIVMLALAARHDIETRRIENGTVLAVLGLRAYELALCAVYRPAPVMPEIRASLAGGAAVLVFLLATAHFMDRLTGSAGIGGGDVKLLAALGFFLGWERGFAIIGLACLIALCHRIRSGDTFPFAPYIAVATALLVPIPLP